MENKTTTELLDLLWKLERKSERDDTALPDEHAEALAELRKRSPFDTIIGDRQNDGFDPSIQETVEDVFDDIKLLKRHKHDPNNGDVLVRI